LSDMITPELIRALPKTDLHVHLDGSLREQSLIEMARERDVRLPADSVESLNALVFKDKYENLEPRGSSPGTTSTRAFGTSRCDSRRSCTCTRA